ncbi:MAG: signal peptidase II [Armatimonadetes bacterium]|jgi:signal peptidase II|nr:signal peptidase II [Armatimonadota bacterium]
MNRRLLFWSLFLGGVLLDQIIKIWARGAMPPGGSLGGKPFPGFFEFTLVFNEGVAFGRMQGYGYLMAPIAIAIAGVAAWWSWKNPQDPKWHHTTAALLAAGAVGNLIDRLLFKKVTDMFHARFINFPVFNLADVLISVAAGMLFLTWLLEAIRERKAAVNPDSAPEV